MRDISILRTADCVTGTRASPTVLMGEKRTPEASEGKAERRYSEESRCVPVTVPCNKSPQNLVGWNILLFSLTVHGLIWRVLTGITHAAVVGWLLRLESCKGFFTHRSAAWVRVLRDGWACFSTASLHVVSFSFLTAWWVRVVGLKWWLRALRRHLPRDKK